ncbi:MAG: Txe/YoeB family addiction module toxin [Paludibacteraceae bacterium]|nr:Txe/YoeB family addiction module toxin [Paludibacteraceae bacterium]
MAYEIKFDETVQDTIKKWKKSNAINYKKLVKVLQAISEDPRNGIGHPEPLIGGGDVVYSRHITASDRIIYRIHDDEVFVLVIQIEGHYKDK